MARYLNESDVYNLLGERGMATVHCSQLDVLPRADVAPREEVAREIFWEMDKLLLSITIDEEAEESFVGFDFDKYIALKKTYTQSETTEVGFGQSCDFQARRPHRPRF